MIRNRSRSAAGNETRRDGLDALTASRPSSRARGTTRWIGLVLGLTLYTVVGRVASPDAVKLILWFGVAAAAAWGYQAVGGTWLDPSRSFRLAVLRGAVSLIVAFAALLLLALVLTRGTETTPSDWKSGVGSMSVPVLLLTLGLKPPVEEILFRGFMYDILAPLGTTAAVIGTSTAFALAHWIGHGDSAYAVAVAPLGLALGALRAYARGIAVPAVFHVALNSILT